MDITIGFFRHSSMDKIMGAAAVNENNHLVVVDATNQLQKFGVRKMSDKAERKV